MSSPASKYLGCSPTLYTFVGPNGLSRQNFKYYVIHGKRHAGIYLDQSVASARAKTTNEREPKGYNDEATVIEAWKFMCQSVHQHPPQELQPFVSPFGQPPTTPAPPSNERRNDQDLSEAARSLSLCSPTPSRCQQKVAFAGGIEPASNSLSAEDLVNLLTAEAAPFPHVLLNSPGKSSRQGTNSGGTPSKPPPTKRGDSSKRQRFTKPDEEANKPVYHPSKPRNVKVQELSSGFPTSESESEDLGKKGKEKETLEPCQFFIVRYRGGCDTYSSQSEATRAFISFKSKGMAPQMRVTEDEKLAEEFMLEKL
ncbi:hypothetical protein K435DRAFT_855318 [Dendrothele bispora CBS 962.96]|uniref:Uncharacterized protein n=1 Tax=Dendrothele bispora (strain CBS 962.96) TaxID=1314807 RepID=A0A4V4HGR0_DENBC|nr:hypothetical protein K435DRAFT_855318 [Dendrothele bispora CBS 962.96]